MFRECSQHLKMPDAPVRWESIGSREQRAILMETLHFPVAVGIIASNRYMRSAMSEQLASFDKDPKKLGLPSPELINLYKKFGGGEFGVIVSGSMPVSWKEIECPGNVVLDAEGRTPERLKLMKEWTNVTKKDGAVFLSQLYHPGKKSSDWIGGPEKFDPGQVSKKELQDLIEKFIDAAIYTESCGFDGVEIPCAYAATLGYLIDSGMNTRTDEYGSGSMENRSRALLEIVTGIRKRIKDNKRFVIGVKLNAYNMAHEYVDSEFRKLLKELEAAGIDYMVITGGHYGLLKEKKCSELQQPYPVDLTFKSMAIASKEVLKSVKIYLNGEFVTVSDMADAVQKGWTTGISIARAAAAETDLPKKISRGLVYGAIKSVIDFNDPISIQIAGTQLWQAATNRNVFDASNDRAVEAFKEFLEIHQQAVDNAKEYPVIGWAKFPGI